MTTMRASWSLGWTEAFGGIWLLLFVPSVWLFHVLGQPAVTGLTRVVATLERSQGDTLFRRSNVTVWTGAVTGQELGNGDLVSTGDGARALLSFKTGEQIELEPGTQFMISERSAADGSSRITIDLVKGRFVMKKVDPKVTPKSLAASVTPASEPAKLAVRNGSQIIELTQSDAPVIVAKDVEAKEAVVQRRVSAVELEAISSQGSDAVTADVVQSESVADPGEEAAQHDPEAPVVKVPADLASYAGVPVLVRAAFPDGKQWSAMLTDGRLLAKWEAALASASEVEIEEGDELDEAEGIVSLLVDGKFAGAIQGAKKGEVRDLARALGASLAFLGPAEAYLGGARRLESLEAGVKVYAVYRDKAVWIDPAVLSLHPDVAKEISRGLKGLFDRAATVWYAP